jgi:hypothetical protein
MYDLSTYKSRTVQKAHLQVLGILLLGHVEWVEAGGFERGEYQAVLAPHVLICKVDVE